MGFWALRSQFYRETQVFFLWMFKPQHPIRSDDLGDQVFESMRSKPCSWWMRQALEDGGCAYFFWKNLASLIGGGNKKSGPKVLCINIYSR